MFDMIMTCTVMFKYDLTTVIETRENISEYIITIGISNDKVLFIAYYNTIQYKLISSQICHKENR